MKKTALCSLVCAALGLFSLQASAENLQNVYQLALKKDPQVLKSAAQRDAAGLAGAAADVDDVGVGGVGAQGLGSLGQQGQGVVHTGVGVDQQGDLVGHRCRLQIGNEVWTGMMTVAIPVCPGGKDVVERVGSVAPTNALAQRTHEHEQI